MTHQELQQLVENQQNEIAFLQATLRELAENVTHFMGLVNTRFDNLENRK